MKKRTPLIPLLTAFGSLFLIISCFGSRNQAAKESAGSATVEAPKYGISIEAKYDVRLDNLIPGYKMVTVGLTNNGADSIRLDPLKDKWEITDAYGKNRRAINSLRIRDARVWSQLPSNLKRLLDYPIAVSMGYTETIDLFFPADVDLTAFRAISFYSAELDQKIDAMSDIDESREVPDDPLYPEKGAPAGKPSKAGAAVESREDIRFKKKVPQN